jgi:hypothetical protein
MQQAIPELLVFTGTLTWLIAREDFRTRKKWITKLKEREKGS